jgi:hypothetical protein
MARLVSNADAFLSRLAREPDRLEKRMVKLVSGIVRFAHRGTTRRTPVHTGQTLRNYTWTVGAPARGVKGDPGGPATGATNRMPLGPEPRRGAAQAEADASLGALVLTSPYQKFYLTNNSPQVVGLEYGRYPLPPLRQRSPNGMFRITLQEIITRLNAGAL